MMQMRKRGLVPILSVVLLALLARCPEAAGHPALGGGYLLQQLPFTPVAWIPLASAAVLTVITVAAIVYALSGAIGSQNARDWSRMQIYEAALSLLLIIIFGAFSYFFFINPQSAFASLNMVPPTSQQRPVSPSIDCTSATDIFELATCDLSMFNRAAFQLANAWYGIAYITSIVPGFDIKIGLASIPGVGFEWGLGSIVPVDYDNLLAFAFSGIMTIMILQQLQLLLISSSLLWLSLFLTIGLIARTFGFTRSFGGAMIAFGLGIGLIYPLLVSVTYGYIDVQGNISCILSTSTWCDAGGYSAGAIINAIELLVTQTTPIGGGGAAYSGFLLQMSYLLAGFTFVPFLNFIIVDTFIIDFSQAIGERMDFMGLLAGIV